MPKLQEYTVYTPDNEVAHLAQGLGMHVHTITGPYHHVLRDAHTVYLFGSLPALRDLEKRNASTISSHHWVKSCCCVTS